jgi:hypothetical protein
MACLDNGTRLEKNRSCGFDSGTYCNPQTGRCASFACEPAQPLCNGELASSCKNDGSGPRDLGVDCVAKGQLCWDGECLPQRCSEPYQCNAQGQLLRCTNHSTALVLEKTCPSGTVCDAQAGTCRRQKCTPSKPACNGSLATTCDETGLGYTGEATDCAALDRHACVDGACLPIICDPDTTYCGTNSDSSASELRRCAPTGTSFTLLETCGDAHFCRAGETTCLPRICSPDSPICSGDRLTRCELDGSGPAPGGIDCSASGAACDLGQCRPIVCAANQRFCSAGDVYLCNPIGTDAAAYDNCQAREYCDATTHPSDAQCSPDICIANRPACASERLATCNADGSATQPSLIDCSASNRVCDLSGACLDAAIDTLGSGAPQSVAGLATHFLLVHATTSRQLSELRVQLTPTTTDPLTWLVYRSSNDLGPFEKILQASAPPLVNAGYVTWTPPSFALEANGSYLIGVSVPAPHDLTVPSDATPTPVSFGQILGGYTLTPATSESAAPATIRIGVGEVGEGFGAAFVTAG